MDILIDGEPTHLPDDTDLTLGESEEVAKHLKIDLGASTSTEKLIGLVFVAVRRKNPDGAIVDQVDAIRKMKIADLGINEEEVAAAAVPLASADADPAENGRSETIHEHSGTPV
jgi:hypothetical protein